jgi:hypothetical protein
MLICSARTLRFYTTKTQSGPRGSSIYSSEPAELKLLDTAHRGLMVMAAALDQLE